MRLSARRANDSRLAGFVGGMEDGNGGVDIVKHFILLPSVQTFNRITLVRVCLSPVLYCISPFICSFDWAGLCEYT